MATDLAEILSDLTAHALASPRRDTAAAADARIGLSRLRPALDQLRDDGLDTGASTLTDPDGFARQAERVHWVRLLANTCARFGDATPLAATPGPMIRLADAAAVTAVLHADVHTSGPRWAIVAGLARVATHLVTPRRRRRPAVIGHRPRTDHRRSELRGAVPVRRPRPTESC